MRYILVMDREPKATHPVYCAWCCTQVEGGYLREIGTRIMYHDPLCYEAHCQAATIQLARLQ